MHREQNVCEQEVMTGVVKKSLQIRHRRAASTGARVGAAVSSQSEGSETSYDLSMVFRMHKLDGHGFTGILNTAHLFFDCRVRFERVGLS